MDARDVGSSTSFERKHFHDLNAVAAAKAERTRSRYQDRLTPMQDRLFVAAALTTAGWARLSNSL